MGAGCEPGGAGESVGEWERGIVCKMCRQKRSDVAWSAFLRVRRVDDLQREEQSDDR